MTARANVKKCNHSKNTETAVSRELYICHGSTVTFISFSPLSKIWGSGVRGLTRGMATVPQGNQELLVVNDKVGRPPGELGVSNSTECDIIPFGA